MLGAAIANLGVPFLVSFLSSALTELDNPLAKGASDALKKVESEIDRGRISVNQINAANHHIEKLIQIRSDEVRANIEQVNKSLREEIASGDQYVRRMRPTFGYIMALSWGAQMFAIAYILVFETAKAALVINAMSSLSAIWAVGLSVLGIYVYKRSAEKKAAGFNAENEVIFWNKPD